MRRDGRQLVSGEIECDQGGGGGQELGVEGGEAFHVVRGQLIYCQESEFGIVDENTETVVEEGTWLCEVALWSVWTQSVVFLWKFEV